MLEIYDIVKRPVVTESSMGALDKSNTYVFEVHREANKVQIRRAVESLFEVTVTSVNTAIVKGKPRRRGRVMTKTPNWKKAFVTLQDGDAIEVL